MGGNKFTSTINKSSIILLFLCCQLITGLAKIVSTTEHRPKITPNQNEIIVDARNSLELLCQSNMPVLWVYPNNTAENWSTILISIRNDSGFFESKLHLQNASYNDVGFYICYHDNGLTEPITENSKDVSSIYVYVRDPEKLFVHDERTNVMIHGIQGKTVLIPCRPTAPDVQVTVESLGHTISYSKQDKRYGVYYTNITKAFDGLYNCLFKRGSVEDLFSYILKISPNTLSIKKPYVEDLSTGLVVGNKMHLACSLRFNPDVRVHLEWLVPDKKQIENGRIVISKPRFTPSASRILSTTDLTIKHLIESDAGSYTCRVSDHNKNVNSTTISIAVLEKGTSYIDLSEDTNSTVTKLQQGTAVQWVVKVKSYPKANLQWFNNRNQIIHTRWAAGDALVRFSVNITDDGTILQIRNIELADDGIYTLRAENANMNKTLNFTLHVLAKPTVQVHGTPFQIYGNYSNLECHVAGNPLPTVSWLYKPCLDNKCDYIKETHFTDNKNDSLHFISFLKLKKNVSGEVKCEAENRIGRDSSTMQYIITDVTDGFKAWREDENEAIALGDTVVMTCAESNHNLSEPLGWWRVMASEKPFAITNKGEYTLKEFSSKYSQRLNLTIKNVTYDHSGEYKCANDKASDTVRLQVKTPAAPVITSTNLNATGVQRKLGLSVEFYCKFEGIPNPKITWKKDNARWVPDRNRTIFYDNQQGVKIRNTQLEDDASYACEVKNRIGTVSKTTVLRIIAPKTNVSILPIIGIVCLTGFLILVVIFLIIKINNEKKLRRELTIAGLANFVEGGVENLNPELSVDDQAELLPYDKKWEFPRENLKLGKQLGSGAFGVVMKAEATGICEEDITTTVAVKMVKKNADYTYIRALASELKIMVHLGKHVNVVNLLGASTKNVAKRELLVIVEYCRFGNLHNYLLRHRQNFIDQLDPTTGELNVNIGAEILARSASMSSSRMRYASLSFSHSGSTSNGPASPTFKSLPVACPGGADYRADPTALPPQRRDSSSSNVACTSDGQVSMAPEGEDAPILSNNSAQPEWRSNYKGDYPGNGNPICTQDLLCWAFQVARGMEYLASRRVLHGDLAARNILLAENNIVKICDFGLAKSMYKNDNYRKKGDGPLPVKWMAVESIRDKIFSTQSDVWSFGIVLWEFFSLARTPYPGMSADERFYKQLVDGYRMDKPAYATKQLFATMMQCWEMQPKDRPTFSTLAINLGAMLEESVREHYIDLNSPYLIMNDQKQGAQNDYLSMMCRPDYDSFVSPTSNYYINELNPPPASPAGDTSGYLCMQTSPNGIFSPREGVTSAAEVFDFSVQNNRKSLEQVQMQEMVPMLNGGGGEPDANQTPLTNSPLLPNSFFNPSYQTPIFKDKVSEDKIVSGADNYVNMLNKNRVPSGTTTNDDLKKNSENDQLYINDPKTKWESPYVN